MPRIQPIGLAPVAIPFEIFSPTSSCEFAAEALAPWRASGDFEQAENRNVLIDEDYFWYDKPPLQNLSSALTIENALLQRNLLLQCGVGYEHVGMLVVYGQYSAKGASLQAVMPAVWASTEYARIVQEKRELLGLPATGWLAYHHATGIGEPAEVDLRA
jgi:hypothetical protein